MENNSLKSGFVCSIHPTPYTPLPSHRVEDALEQLILLSPPSKCRYCRHVTTNGLDSCFKKPFKNIYLFSCIALVFTCMYACVLHVCLVPKETRKVVADPWELGLQTIVNHYVGTRN